MSSTACFRRPRLTTLLAVAAIGVYLLVVIGATTAITEAAETCSGWPVCDSSGAFSAPLMLVALGHRAVAAVVGVVLLVVTVVAWHERTTRRVMATLAIPVSLYPIQVGLGALAATGEVGWVPSAHLAVGMAIFVGLVVALAWALEAENGIDETDEAILGDTIAPDPVSGTARSGSPTGGATDWDDEAGIEPGDANPGATSGSNPNPGPNSALAPSLAGTSLPTRVRATLAAYVGLTKPRLMWLLCLVAAAAMALAAGPALEAHTVVLTLFGGVLAIGASGTFNHVLERDVDRRMARTANRPLASHKVPLRNAVVFGFALAFLSLWVFLRVTLLAAVLGLVAIVFYSVIYTLVLKPNTVQNTVIGGAAGALPALIGWAAVTGEIGLPGLALAGVIFLWTPAHFYNLALAYKDDYARGGFPMLPVVRGEAVTRRHVLWYLGATLLGASALAAVTSLGWVFAAATVGLGGAFLWAVVRLHRDRTERAAFRAFHASNAYLGVVLLAIVVDALVV